MNAKQRELISDLYKELLENSVSGDLASSFNNSKSCIKDLAETDEKLQYIINDIERDFENS